MPTVDVQADGDEWRTARASRLDDAGTATLNTSPLGYEPSVMYELSKGFFYFALAIAVRILSASS